jgi:NAD(P)H-dependent FMN reductase
VPASYVILAISGSLRARSSNTEVLRAAAALAPLGASISLFDGLAELPHFNPDLDAEGAVLPPAVQRLREQVGAADALLICSPEYAHGVPGSLKNALDWLVSGSEIPYKPVVLLNASSRSRHAQASLAETLRTMSTLIVTDGPIDVPLDGRRLDANAIVEMPDLANRIRAAWTALIAAVDASRQRRMDLGPAA